MPEYAKNAKFYSFCPWSHFMLSRPMLQNVHMLKKSSFKRLWPHRLQWGCLFLCVFASPLKLLSFPCPAQKNNVWSVIHVQSVQNAWKEASKSPEIWSAQICVTFGGLLHLSPVWMKYHYVTPQPKREKKTSSEMRISLFLPDLLA